MTYLNFSFNLLPVAIFSFFFFNDPATTEFSPLPLPAALPILLRPQPAPQFGRREEPHPQAGPAGRQAPPDGDVRLARPVATHKTTVVLLLDPFTPGQLQQDRKSVV